MDTLSLYVPDFVDALSLYVPDFVDALSLYVPDFVNALSLCVPDFVNALSLYVPDFVDVLSLCVPDFVDFVCSRLCGRPVFVCSRLCVCGRPVFVCSRLCGHPASLCSRLCGRPIFVCSRLCGRPLYVPDFVDALSAPIQFMTQAEKRAKQLQEMGIEEADLAEAGNDVCSTNKKEPHRNSDSKPNYSTQISEKEKGRVRYITIIFHSAHLSHFLYTATSICLRQTISLYGQMLLFKTVSPLVSDLPPPPLTQPWLGPIATALVALQEVLINT